MQIRNDIAGDAAAMTEWRRDLHQHPEVGFEEHRTSAIVAEKLAAWGIEVTRGLGGTGVVGTLRCGSGDRVIGLRADMDALPMIEEGEAEYRSRNVGAMHGCGHDGHTTMLLGAARHLAKTRDFDGTVQFIFQPAEEGRGGARRMIEDGLFTRFPCDAVYGIHNDPNLPLGTVAVKAGVVTAASARVWIEIEGRGGHASRPQDTIDPVMIGAYTIVALQTLVSRRVDPIVGGVVSITQFHAGSTGNVIPSQAVLNGTIRALDLDLHRDLCRWVEEVAVSTARLHGATAKVRFEGQVSTTVNADAPTRVMEAAAARVVGEEMLLRSRPTEMGGEDFSEMSHAAPACFIFLGQAQGETGAVPLHNPRYDFNDALLPIGASLWSALVEAELPRR